MKINKRLFLLVFIILILIFSAAIFYLNSVILPSKIKSLIVQTLEQKTSKNVGLESLQFNIFKGLVLRNLAVYDEKGKIITLKEGSFTFLILPLFKKKLVIPNLNLRSLVVFLERKPDSPINLQDLFPGLGSPASSGTNVLVYKVNIIDAKVHFQDKTFTPAFTKEIEALNLRAQLALPAAVKFDLTAEIPTSTDKPIVLDAEGEFKIPDQRLSSKIRLRDFTPQEFIDYYKDAGVVVSGGLTDGVIDMEFKEDTLYADLELKNRDLSISKEKISSWLNADIKMSLLYNFQEKQFGFSGKAKVYDTKIQGFEFFGSLYIRSGDISFSDSEISSDNLKADVWGMPLEIKAAMEGLPQPQLHLSALSELDLDFFPALLKDKFDFSSFREIKGKASLSFNLNTHLAPVKDLSLSGLLDILSADLKLEKLDSPLEDIKGKLEFTEGEVKWPELHFKYQGTPYKTEGVLNNFLMPQVQLTLSSSELSLKSDFTINNKIVKLSRCEGQYLDSDFSITGLINTQDTANLQTDISGRLGIDLKDLKVPLKKYEKQLEKIKPEGLLQADVAVNGPINDIKACAIKAKLSSTAFSAYGLKAKGLELSYNQENGLAQMPLARLSMYDGLMEVNATMNLKVQNFPYRAAINIQGVKIEKLKLDTGAKDKDIAGIVHAQAKLSGASTDLSLLNGEGKILVTEGKLWQLNLFQGLGALLFAKRDFANIVFEQGTCDFIIKDKSIFTDNLFLKSTITDLSGSVKLSFNNSIDAALNVHVLDDKVPLAGTFKDITTAIVGQGGLFGVIKISGTLNEPKYKFQTAVMSILKGLKDTILGR
jgi:uncharacterized protein involved in outer membrane biogenesis